MKSANRVIVAMILVTALAAVFWTQALGPKRQQVGELNSVVANLEASLTKGRHEMTEALAARRGFSSDYRQLVVLGKAVPSNDETASLLVELNQIAKRAGVRFQELSLEGSGAPAGATAATAPTPVTPTEAAASVLPLGATVGAAGLATMPYTLTFTGSFFHVADFIHGLDALVKTTNSRVAVDGRLVTVDGFSLAAQPGKTFPHLQATFKVTTYLTPPGQGPTAGASPEAPALTGATPAAATTGGAP